MEPSTTATMGIDLKDIISHAKEYGFVFPSSEIYDGLQAVYDYGQNGVQLKNNLKQVWWKAMTQARESIVGIDAAIFMHPLTWKASGHVDAFNDPMIDNKDSKKRYRADVLIEDKAAQYENAGHQQKARDLLAEIGRLLTAEDMAGVRDLIVAEDIRCPLSGSANWTDVRQFNLMFSTQVGSVAEDADTIYLRPETAQGIFVNYLNVQKTGRMKVPFGIAQIGKAFRNEIVARQFIFRMREFEQMEMQFFIRPGTENEWYEHWKEQRLRFHKAIGLLPENLRYHDHDKLAHYAKAACDIEYKFPFGFKEMEGIHSRTDFDLKSHQELSGKKIQYFDNEINQNYTPYVIETSVGADRLFLATFCQALRTVTSGDGEDARERTILDLHPALAPIKAAILPITKKDGLPEKGEAIFNALHHDFECYFEEKDSIGKRYTRQDLIGTPFCIAVDHQTLEDDTVTIRHRNTGMQERQPIASLSNLIGKQVSLTSILRTL
jgi:glycyl-tRNA synthetase